MQNLSYELYSLMAEYRREIYLVLACAAAVGFWWLCLRKHVISFLRRRDRGSAGRVRMAVNTHQIRAKDPTFSEPVFLKLAQETFDAVQSACKTGDFGSIRTLVSSELHHSLVDANEQDRASGRRTVVRHLKLRRIDVQSAVNLGAWQTIVVRMTASGRDYSVDSKGHTEGSRKSKVWREDWTFERSIDSATETVSAWALTRVEPVATGRFDADGSSKFRPSFDFYAPPGSESGGIETATDEVNWGAVEQAGIGESYGWNPTPPSRSDRPEGDYDASRDSA